MTSHDCGIFDIDEEASDEQHPAMLQVVTEFEANPVEEDIREAVNDESASTTPSSLFLGHWPQTYRLVLDLFLVTFAT